MREEFKERVEQILAKREHTLVKGKHGIGKSYTLKELASKNSWLYLPYCKPPKTVVMSCLQQLLEHGRDHPDYKSFNREEIYALCDRFIAFLRTSRKRIVIVLDEIHTVTPQASLIFNYLIESSREDQRITFIGIATDQYLINKVYKPEMKRFFWELHEVEMPPMCESESKELVEDLESACGVKIIPAERQKIIKNSKGNPLEIQQQIVKLARLKADKREGVNAIDKPTTIDRDYGGAIRDQGVNLFPLVILALLSIAGLRYLLRGMSLPELAGFSGFIGLMIIFGSRIFLMRKDTFTWR